MSVLLANATLLEIDPIRVGLGSLRIDGGTIVERGDLTPRPGDDVIDCGGAVVLPGLVNGHTHLYSALAVGMPPPPTPPRDFPEILRLIWWRLDCSLDAELIECSARIGAIEALRCGTTTLIDHHSSPNRIARSLDLVEQAIDSVGLRAVLCYETTDRNGRTGFEQGLDENRRYLAKCRAQRDGKFAAMAGAHASFTLEDGSLDALVALADEFDVGIHIHVAEDPCDEATCRREHGVSLIDRLASHGLLRPHNIFAHGTHLGTEAIDRVNAAGLSLAHCPRSNMNNAVGYSPIGKLKCPVMLGTDGIGADMFAEAQQAWFKSCDARAGLSPTDVIAMLAASARRASAALGATLGQLTIGAAADIVVTDYLPFTPLTDVSAAGHALFALGARHVRHVLVEGRCLMRDRRLLTCDEMAVRRQGANIAIELWRRMPRRPHHEAPPE